jgi:Zn-dependent metalloprotease
MWFFDTVLQRDGVDGKNMPLVSIVNCVYRPSRPDSRELQNAFWDRDGHRMLYGQTMAADLGRLVSYSRFIDVIAHELTHGVTQFTCELDYVDESGALDESFSDIFAVIIKNWDGNEDQGGTVTTWDWEIGAGLGGNGLPLRDMKDPKRTGNPDHMDAYAKGSGDHGHVHTNSNIHNKAAFNVLTAVGADGRPLFSPYQAARLFYLTLQQLSRLATFSDARLEMLDVAASMTGDTAELDERVAGIKAAYTAVGIT